MCEDLVHEPGKNDDKKAMLVLLKKETARAAGSGGGKDDGGGSEKADEKLLEEETAATGESDLETAAGSEGGEVGPGAEQQRAVQTSCLPESGLRGLLREAI
jgi:hypothetical protein